MLYYDGSTGGGKRSPDSKFCVTTMFFSINPSNGVPVYEQVARQIMFAVASGGLATGEMIPSVREMARQLAINPNTVARAYRQLQDQEVLETVRGEGLVVAKGAKVRCKTARTKLIRAQIAQVLEAARQSQLSDTEIKKMVESELDKRT